ncbi:MAG TPA: tyrosine--tRNA ligase [Mycobacteriales bacterium]|nr:tyrosine--tRNA ligase [Mycobacteriales bacterium]
MTETTAAHPPATRDDLPPRLREAHDRLAYGAAEVLPADGLAERLLAADAERRPLRVKLGIDPSGSSLTLGHAVVLRKLRQFQDLGHIAVLIVGGFTGRVGDPSGRTNTRAALSAEQTADNARTYFEQLMRILDPDRVEVRDNSEWLDSLTMGEIMGYAREVTVARLLERDDFARRFSEHLPISLVEFFYPLLQGIDSVAVRADVELGGTDQTFNNLMGRELQRSHGQAPQAVLTVPLLVGLDGAEKMGKSLGNWVGIEEPPAEQFGKLMSIPDSVIGHYAQLTTDLQPAEVDQLARAAAEGGPPANQAKRRVARAVVALYHGQNAAEMAERRFDTVFRQHEVPDDVPERPLPPGDPVHVPTLLVDLGFAPSTTAARRLVDNGAVRVDGERLAARDYDQPRDRLAGHVLATGKRRLARLSD